MICPWSPAMALHPLEFGPSLLAHPSEEHEESGEKKQEFRFPPHCQSECESRRVATAW